MSKLLIDDAGTVWPAKPEFIIRRFGLRHPRDFVFRAIDLGFVFVTLGECGVRIALRPQFVARSAVSRLFGIIGRRSPARVALAWDARLSSWELIAGGDRTIARIEQLMAEARNPSPRPLLTDQRLPLERCLDVRGGAAVADFGSLAATARSMGAGTRWALGGVEAVTGYGDL